MNESNNVRKNVSMMLTGMVIGAALTGGSIAVAAGITAEPTWQPIFVDGQQVEVQAYNIAGHNYVQLRDMGKQVGFNVYWNAGVQIDTGHPYTGIAPAASGIRVSSYKGSTLRPGDRSGLNISPSADIKSVVSTQPNVIRIENASGFWTAIAVSSGTSDVVVTNQHGQTATLTLTVVDGKQGASIPESGASQTDAARQEIVRLVNQVRRENGVPELTINAALMDAAQHCASLRVAYHQNKVECEAVAVCSGDDDCLANAGGGSKPCSCGGIAAFDTQIHEEQAFLNDQQTGQHRQQAHDLAPFDLALLRGSALAPCHQLSPNFWAKR